MAWGTGRATSHGPLSPAGTRVLYLCVVLGSSCLTCSYFICLGPLPGHAVHLHACCLVCLVV